jgi:toxin ParE1/3/4
MPSKRRLGRRKFEVVFRPQAETDLLGLYRYIAEQAGHAVASAYIDRIEAACMALERFPDRGTSRDDIRPSLRTIGFERRVTIVFQVRKAKVIIIHIVKSCGPYCG